MKQTPENDPICWCGNSKSDCDEHCSLCGKGECSCFQGEPTISEWKSRIYKEHPDLIPSGGHDLLDEILGLLRVAQGQRDADELQWHKTQTRAIQARDTKLTAASEVIRGCEAELKEISRMSHTFRKSMPHELNEKCANKALAAIKSWKDSTKAR